MPLRAAKTLTPLAAGCLDHAGSRGIDHGGDTAGLGIQQVAGDGGRAALAGHGNPRWQVSERGSHAAISLRHSDLSAQLAEAAV